MPLSLVRFFVVIRFIFQLVIFQVVALLSAETAETSMSCFISSNNLNALDWVLYIELTGRAS